MFLIDSQKVISYEIRSQIQRVQRLSIKTKMVKGWSRLKVQITTTIMFVCCCWTNSQMLHCWFVPLTPETVQVSVERYQSRQRGDPCRQVDGINTARQRHHQQRLHRQHTNMKTRLFLAAAGLAVIGN